MRDREFTFDRPPPSATQLTPRSRTIPRRFRAPRHLRQGDRPSRRRARADRLVVRAEDSPEVPEFLKDPHEAPRRSVAAPGWLAPLINLAEEAGESAPVVGYGIMGATGVFFALFAAIIGLGAFGFIVAMAGTGYACWQASPYLSEIGSRFDVMPEQPPSAPEDEE